MMKGRTHIIRIKRRGKLVTSRVCRRIAKGDFGSMGEDRGV